MIELRWLRRRYNKDGQVLGKAFPTGDDKHAQGTASKMTLQSRMIINFQGRPITYEWQDVPIVDADDGN